MTFAASSNIKFCQPFNIMILLPRWPCVCAQWHWPTASPWMLPSPTPSALAFYFRLPSLSFISIFSLFKAPIFVFVNSAWRTTRPSEILWNPNYLPNCRLTPSNKTQIDPIRPFRTSRTPPQIRQKMALHQIPFTSPPGLDRHRRGMALWGVGNRTLAWISYQRQGIRHLWLGLQISFPYSFPQGDFTFLEGEFWWRNAKRPSRVAPHLPHPRLCWRELEALWEWEDVLWEKRSGGYAEDLWSHRKADRHCLSWVSINMNSATMSNSLGLLALYSETVFLDCHKMGKIFSILLSRPL